MSTWTPLAPTQQAIDDWLAKDEALRRGDGSRHASDGSFGVDVKTKASMWRCITSRVVHHGEVYYWTISGEGSSNSCREYPVRASDVVEARGWRLPGY